MTKREAAKYHKEWHQKNRSRRLKLSKQYYEKHREQHLRSGRLNKRRVKIRCVAHLGGKCAKCGLGYDGTNAAVFHFHHRDPKTKKFAIGTRTVHRWVLVSRELAKCDMLCANCHALVHGGGW